MRKLWKGVLLGAAVGGTVKAVQEVRGDGSIEEVGPAVAKAAGQAAAAGAVVGFLLDRRDRRKLSRMQRAKAKASLGTVVAGASALADTARPAFEAARERAEKAAEVAVPAAVAAAEVARRRASEAAEAAKPHASHAAEVARKRAHEAAEAAKPHASHAADLAKVRAEKAGKKAKAKLAELDLPVLVAV